MKHLLFPLALLLLTHPERSDAADSVQTGNGDPSRYNVVWNSPSKDHNGSMPLGNGDIALNAWVEESGDLLFYIGKTDSWDDNGRLVKVGRLRISLDPRPSGSLPAFEQTLDLPTATLQVRYGERENEVAVRVWVDANHPVIRVEVESKKPVQAVASIEMWRTGRFVLPSLEVSDIMSGRKTEDNKQMSVIVEPDSVLTHQTGRIGWFHHNGKSVGPELSAAIQGLQGYKRPYPLLHRTFGAVVTAENAEVVDDLHLRSPKSSRHLFNICVLTKHPAKPQEWLKAVEEVIAETNLIPVVPSRKEHEQWWEKFWDRSWIHVTSNGARGSATDDDTYVVSRAYALQRFINACAGRGRYPIKFNGSLFTVPYRDRPGDADYRQWGPGYWWQNTRLPYISMPASGDFDLMEPLFRMYGKELMPLFRYRTRHYLNHDGAFIPECIYFWGDIFSETYGWTPFEQRSDKLQESRWHKWEWVSGPELVWMMLDYYEYTLDGTFLQETVLPTAHEILTFFDQHYTTDGSGRMLMYPSQACETWWDCTNPMPEVAGLHAVVNRLLSLPEKSTTVEQKGFWARFKKKLPDPPIHTVDGKTMLAPAARFEMKQNIENPELYAVFPFRLFGFNLPKKELALEAFRQRQDRGNFGWRQDGIFAAYLGLADSVRDDIVGRAKNKHSDSRFPAFWGPNYDWIPDQDHGGILLKTLQAMVMQTDGRDMYLLPAWPKDWNVAFKLRAPYNTTIEGRYVNGKVEGLSVTPAERLKDLKVSGKP
jgi:alpha-L-fucosidase 2